MIEVENLTKRFGSVLAVDGLSFRAEPGKVTGFLGPNGAGKTTTLRALVALLHPTAGTATVLGRPYAELESPGRRVGAILEVNAFHPGRSGRNHLRTLAVASGIDESRVDTVLALVDLSAAANRKVKGYSLGMKQRLAPRGRTPRRARSADPRRAGERPRPAGHPLAPRPAQEARRRGAHPARLQPRALGDGTARGRRRDHREGPLGHAGADPDDPRERRARHARAHAAARRTRRRAESAQGIESTPFEDDALVSSAEAPRIGELAAREGIVLHELAAVAESLEDVFLQLTEGESSPS